MRLRIISGNLLIVVALGVFSFFLLKSQMSEKLAEELDRRVADESILLDRSWKLSALQFVQQVVNRASTNDVRSIFSGLDENKRREKAHNYANGVVQWFRDPARGRLVKPDFVAVTDAQGKIIARDSDVNRMYGVSMLSSLPSSSIVFDKGESQHDVWFMEENGKLLQVGVAPIRDDRGSILGALYVGFDLSNQLVAAESKLLGRDVAVLLGNKVYSSSLNGNTTKALQGYLFGEEQQRSLQFGNAKRVPWNAVLEAEQWIGIIAEMPMSPSMNVGYVLLANKDDRFELADSLLTILLLTIFAALGVCVYGFVIANQTLKPIEELEEGVLAVINGRTDFRLDSREDEFGGLAYRINQILNIFTGVVESNPASMAPSPSEWPAAPESEEPKD